MTTSSSPKRGHRLFSVSPWHFLACFVVLGALILAGTYRSMVLALMKPGLAAADVGRRTVRLQSRQQQDPQANVALVNSQVPADPSLARLRHSLVAATSLTASGYKLLHRHPICSFLEAGEKQQAPEKQACNKHLFW